MIKKRRNKYNNKEIWYDDILFRSKKEFHYYLVLVEKLMNHKIKEFQCQVPYILIPKGKTWSGRARKYIADFVVKNLDGSTEVIDVKGMRTELYKFKRDMMLNMYGIRIKEV